MEKGDGGTGGREGDKAANPHFYSSLLSTYS